MLNLASKENWKGDTHSLERKGDTHSLERKLLFEKCDNIASKKVFLKKCDNIALKKVFLKKML